MKVYILRWKATGLIGGIYTDHDDATGAAKKLNKNRRWIHRRLGLTNTI